MLAWAWEAERMSSMRARPQLALSHCRSWLNLQGQKLSACHFACGRFRVSKYQDVCFFRPGFGIARKPDDANANQHNFDNP